MEDVVQIEHGLKDGFTLAAVYDGHGGARSAQWLGANLPRFVAPRAGASLLRGDDDAGPPAPGDAVGDAEWRVGWLSKELLPGLRWPAGARRLFAEAFREADAELIRHLKAEAGDRMGASGATALVALVHPTRAVFASLGDCLAVVARGAGGAGKASREHRVYGFGPGVMEEQERIEATGAWLADGRVCGVLAVSRAFGDPEFKGEGLKMLLREGANMGLWDRQFASTHRFKSDPVIVEPDVTEVVFGEDDDCIIVATDGLWDALPVPDAAALATSRLARGGSCQEAAEALAEAALKRGTQDNVSVIVVDVRTDARRRRQREEGPPGKGGGGGGWLGGLFGGR